MARLLTFPLKNAISECLWIILRLRARVHVRVCMSVFRPKSQLSLKLKYCSSLVLNTRERFYLLSAGTRLTCNNEYRQLAYFQIVLVVWGFHRLLHLHN